MNENLPIDPAMLDEEWLQQPLHFDQAQQEATDCLKDRDDLKDGLAVFEANKAMEYRSDAEANKVKLTEKALLEMLLVDPEVIEKRKALNVSSYQLNLANNTVRSFEMRKSALAKLTDLHISNYFSIPNPGRLVTEGKRYIDIQNEANKELSKSAINKLNENKKKRTTSERIDNLSEGAKESLKKCKENVDPEVTEHLEKEEPKRSRRKRR